MATTQAQRDAAAALLDKAEQHGANNVTYLDIVAPTNAQVVAQVKALTRQFNVLGRLVCGMYGRHVRLQNGSDT